jgi:hypothetical protein
VVSITLQPLYIREENVITTYVAGWVGSTAGLKGKTSCHCWDSNLGPVNQQLVAIPTTVFRLQTKIYGEKN